MHWKRERRTLDGESTDPVTEQVALIRVALPANVVADVFLTNTDSPKLRALSACEPELELRSAIATDAVRMQRVSKSRLRLSASAPGGHQFVARLCRA